ncbi:MAG: FliH/SctL family protein [Dongiaceae bacterium]
MQASEKYLFDSSFDDEAGDANAAATPAAAARIHYDAADLAAARDEGFAAGAAAGAAEARATIERTTADGLTAIVARLKSLYDRQAEAAEHSVRGAVGTAIAIVRKLHPELARRHGLVEIEGLLSRTLETLRDEPRLVVRVADGLLDPLRDRLDDMTRTTGFEGRLVLLADAAITSGDCRIEWADGGVERDAASLWRDIETAWRRGLGGVDDGHATDGVAAEATAAAADSCASDDAANSDPKE